MHVLPLYHTVDFTRATPPSTQKKYVGEVKIVLFISQLPTFETFLATLLIRTSRLLLTCLVQQAPFVFVFLHSFIGYSSYNIQNKIIIQQKKKRKEKKQEAKRARCDGTNVLCEAPPPPPSPPGLLLIMVCFSMTVRWREWWMENSKAR